MKKILFILLVGTILGICQSADAKKVRIPKMYIFGMAASFNDTIIHFTSIQEMDSVWINTKGKFLDSRELYSLQLRNFLNTSKQMPHRTCLVVANKSRKKLEKKFKKLYTESKDQKQHYDVRYIESQEFLFNPIRINDIDDGNATE